MNCGLRVLDVMTVKPVVASPNLSIRDAAVILDRYGIGSVLIQENNELLGIVTERDFVRRAILEGHDLLHTKVSAIMTRDLVTISPGMDVMDALQLMKDADVRHLPVMDEHALVGFVTVKDILKIQPHLIENIVDAFDLREEDRKPLGKIRRAI